MIDIKDFKNVTAMEICELAEELENGNYKTIDIFLFKMFDWDHQKLPFYKEVKRCLEAIMELDIIDHPNGYKIYQWQSK